MLNWPPHLFGRGRRPRLPVLASALAVSAVIPLCSSATAQSVVTYQVPAAIADDCSVDVTHALSAWIASVPDDSTLSFGPTACYRIEGTLEVANRNGLIFEGNGATFKATTTGDPRRAHWRFVDGSQIIVRNMMVRGPRSVGGTFVSDLQWQHAIDVRGTAGVEIDGVDASGVYGDCIYLGQGYGMSKSWSSGVYVHHSMCTRNGRMGIAVTAGRDVLVEWSTFSHIGLSAFDIEPNGPGFGGEEITFTNNQVGAVYDYVFVAISDGPIDNVTVSYNKLVGKGMRMGVFAAEGQRRSNIQIVGNTSDTGYYENNGSAMRFIRVSGLTVTQNLAPLSGSNMALASVSASCDVAVRENRFPGGVIEARISPMLCSFTPTSGDAGATVTITGANFSRATAVAFNGTPAPFTINSDAHITATVPSGAGSGPITVTTPDGAATSGTSFTVTEPAPPLPTGSIISVHEPAPGCTIVGTAGDDVLVGTPGPDVLCCLGGKDNIWGKAGSDLLVGGPGKDRLVGGGGKDRLVGGGGKDRLVGGPGKDRLVGGPGKDRLVGGPGNDAIFGRAGRDVLIGGKGSDRLVGQAGDDTLFSRDYRCDRLVAGSGRDRAQLDRCDLVRSVEFVF